MAVFENVEAFVASLGGKRVLKKILVANNGMAALKAIRSMRRWSYETFGDERQIHFVVMATPQDLGANAEYIRMADEFVEVPGGANNCNYANVRLIIEIAESRGCDAVWAGWGHASENPTLPNGLLAAKGRDGKPIAFIGPPAGPMHALGDKIGSTIIAQSAGVPCVAWNGGSLRVNYKETGMPAEVYDQANVCTVEEAVAAAEAVGYPLMIKASEGGGGKGIRKVTEPAALPAAYRQVQGEVPGSPIFIMRLAKQARHLEVQLLADEYGGAIALFGRDCSVQRRHQKIVEEGPVLAAPPATWAQMERAAVRLAKEVGYVNAGTVEYLFMEDDGSFAFLELNPRLQVEHPVTEMITGVNLPAAQLQVAMGIPLTLIADVRKLYGLAPVTDIAAAKAAGVPVDFDTDATERVRPAGHVIAARITAENPDSGFQPTSGAITELNFRSTPDVWGYFSVDSSSRVHEFADSQIGHLFAWGDTREQSRQHMVLALKELSIRGDIRTTVEYLVHMMESGDFKANAINTSWLDARISANVTASKPDARLVAMVGAVWRAHAAYERRRSEFIGYLERGQYPPPSLLSVDDAIDLIHGNTKYSLRATRSGPNTITLACNGSYVAAEFRPLADGGLLVMLGGRAHVAYASEEPSGLRLVLDGATCLFTNEYDPTCIRAAMSGKIARYLVEDGAPLPAGAPFAEVEVMKMYMPLTIPEGGTISLLLPEGSVLEPGDVIARVALDDPSKVHRAELFVGTLPHSAAAAGSDAAAAAAASSPSSPESVAKGYAGRWHAVARAAARTLTNVGEGYVLPSDVYAQAWADRDAAYACPELPLAETEEVLSVLASRLPQKVAAGLRGLISAHKEASAAHAAAAAAALAASPSSVPSLPPALDVQPLSALLDEHAASLPAGSKDAAAFATLAAPLREVLARYAHGPASAGRAVLLGLLRAYLDVERLFGEGRRPEDVIADLRAGAGKGGEGLGRVYDTLRAHVHLKQRSALVLAALQRISEELEVAKSTAAAAAAAAAASGIGPCGSPVTYASVLSPANNDGTGAPTPLTRGGSVGGGKPAPSFAFSVSSRSITGSEGGGMGGFGGPDGSASEAGPAGAGMPEEEEVDEAEMDIISPPPKGGAASATSAAGGASGGSPLGLSGLRELWPLLHQLAELRGAEYAEVTLEARQMLITHQLPSRKQRRGAVEQLLTAMGSPASRAAGGDAGSVGVDALTALVEDEQPLLDELLGFFGHAAPQLKANAAEVYVRRLYRAYALSHLGVTDAGSPGSQRDFLSASWAFTAHPTPGPAVASRLHAGGASSGSLLASARSDSFADLSSVLSGSAVTPRLGEPELSAAPSPGASTPVPGVVLPSAGGLTSPSHAAIASGAPRHGVMAVFASLGHLRERFPALLAQLQAGPDAAASPSAATARSLPFTGDAASEPPACVHVLHVGLLRNPLLDAPPPSGSSAGGAPRARLGSGGSGVTGGGVPSVSDALGDGNEEGLERGVVAELQAHLAPYHAAMRAAGVRRITFIVPHPGSSSGPASYTTSLDSHTPLTDAARAFVAAVYAAGLPLTPEAAAAVAAALPSSPSSGVPGSPAGSASSVVGGVVRGSGSSGGSLRAFPWVYTFRSSLGYGEDSIVRHMQPPSSAALELHRLAAFKIRLVHTPNRAVHVYAAEPKDDGKKKAGGEGEGGRGVTRMRFFVRCVVRQAARIPTLDSVYEQYPGPERMFVECLDALSVAMGDGALKDTTLPVGNNHIFLNLSPVVTAVRPEYVEAVIKILARRYAERLRRLRVAQVEFRIVVQPGGPGSGSPPIALRLVSSNPTGYVLRVDTYVEARDEARPASTTPIFTSIAPAALGASWASAGGNGGHGGWDAPGLGSPLSTGRGGGAPPSALASLGLSHIHASAAAAGGAAPSMGGSGAGGSSSSYRGELDGKPVTFPYPVASPFERQRALAAALSDTIYCYDFIELFSRSLEHQWHTYARSRGPAMPVRRPTTVLKAVELVMRPKATPLVNKPAAPHGNKASAPSGGPAAPASVGGPLSGPSGGVPLHRSATAVFIDQFANEMAQTTGAGHAHAATGGAAGAGVSAPSPTPDSAPNSARPGAPASAPSAPSAPLPDSSDASAWELVESSRAPGLNDVGMVAWRLTLFTPQYPEEAGGREVVLIANDITFRAGSFGTAEDTLFYLASVYARERGIPRVYLAANSGARIGLAEEVKKMFRVAWNDPSEPSKGFKYLYLSPDDYARLMGTPPPPPKAVVAEGGAAGASEGAGASASAVVASLAPASAPGSPPSDPSCAPPVVAHRIVDPASGEERWVVTDIIGREPDLGVENLRGSGLIAGETSRAYAQSVTLTYVTGRSVGIGAYLVRLGQRTIQKASSAPIILTGYEALNKLLGGDVYTSNLQIGGPKVMYANGVSHQTVDNDYEGVCGVLTWLSYVPRVKGAPLPVMDVQRGDEVDRDVGFAPPAAGQPYDPRHMLAGHFAAPPAPAPGDAPAPPSPASSSASASASPVGSWVSGFFDRDSWSECLGGWARTVVTGRARLGGIPVGVIVPELRSTSAVIPADPASPSSQEQVIPQAGQVWYPDSAFKTAQSLRDFSGEDLPIVIFANWRGFSGGQRDMFDEVLKFGAYIVDALVGCTSPVFVYIPPGGELRGGAWVVVDPSINPEVMEMYADPQGRGGVLEPSGTASIKFRSRELMAAAHRLDPALGELDAQLKAAVVTGASSVTGLKKAIRSREEALGGIYLQVAHTFADLHDTPGRMMGKGVISGVVPLRRARAFFYWRLRRRLAEHALVKRLTAAAPQLGFGHAVTLLRGWYREALASEGTRVAGEAAEAAAWRDDMRVLRWLADTRDALEARALALRRESIAESVLALGLEDPSALVTGTLALINRLPLDRREAVLAQLRRGVIFSGSSPFAGAPTPTAHAHHGGHHGGGGMHGLGGGSPLPPGSPFGGAGGSGATWF